MMTDEKNKTSKIIIYERFWFGQQAEIEWTKSQQGKPVFNYNGYQMRFEKEVKEQDPLALFLNANRIEAYKCNAGKSNKLDEHKVCCGRYYFYYKDNEFMGCFLQTPHNNCTQNLNPKSDVKHDRSKRRPKKVIDEAIQSDDKNENEFDSSSIKRMKLRDDSQNESSYENNFFLELLNENHSDTESIATSRANCWTDSDSMFLSSLENSNDENEFLTDLQIDAKEPEEQINDGSNAYQTVDNATENQLMTSLPWSDVVDLPEKDINEFIDLALF